MPTIVLTDLNLGTTLPDQASKVNEEYAEFTLAQVKDPDPDRVAEEAFDLIEAVVRYLNMRGIDIHRANQRHLEKLLGRHRNESM